MSLEGFSGQDTLKSRSAAAALVIGGGIAGIQAALDMAEAGFQVYLVEKSSSIGGRMAQLDKTFPTLDCSSCILTPKMADIGRNPKITLLTNSEVLSVQGQVGDFRVLVEKKPRYVDVSSCTGCGLCAEVCPVVISSDFNMGLSVQKAIHRRFPQAIPAAYIIEKTASPCKIACPAHIPVQGYVALIAQGKYKQALDLIYDVGVPFAGTLGRVCYHPCELECERGGWEEPVAICALKRFVSDQSSDGNSPQPIEPKWDERIAIVGAGPAGLTAAYELVRRGYRVTVFDALPVIGGMLAVGIPTYRLPRDVLQHEIDYIRSLGVEIQLNTPIGKTGGLKLQDLQKNYNAVFLALGAQTSSRLNIPGEELPGVVHGLSFLKDLNLGKTVEIGQRVAVIGGGNTAIDAARSALRLGGEVNILYRRSRAEMPAAPYEVDAAELEGVKLNFLVSPIQILEKDGRVGEIECLRMQLGEPDASGRRRPVPIPGSEFTLEVDMVIAAVGQSVDADGMGVDTTRWGTFVADPETLETNQAGVFAGGDAVTGPASVVEAIGSGIKAAESIHRYLRQIDLRSGRRSQLPEPKIRTKVSKSQEVARVRIPELPVAERIHNFREVELGLSIEDAMAEAQRCLECAVCSECMQCVSVCQREAIHHNQQPEQLELEVGAIVVATGFDLFDAHRKPEFSYGVYPQVITSLEFERLASASGPTAGKIVLDNITGNGHQPRQVVFIQCVGSRDQSLGIPYCSRVCCMAVAKQAHLAHDRLPGAQITVFYMDVRAFGKGFEEFYDRVRNEGIIYRRGNPSEIIRRGDRVVVRAEDTLLGESVEVEADLVVLATGIQPRQNSSGVAEVLRISTDKDGFFQEAHAKLRSMESNFAGIFLAGCCQGPKDIPDTVAQAKAAAAAAMTILVRTNHKTERGNTHA